MAKKKYKETVASVVALAVGAFLLGKVKNNNSSMTGITSKKNYVVSVVTARGKNVSYTCYTLEECEKYKRKLLREYRRPRLVSIHRIEPFDVIEFEQYPNG